MVRLSWERFTGLLVVGTLIGCAAAAPRRYARAPPPHEPAFTAEEREAACIELRDHIVGLFADEWADSEGIERTAVARAVVRNGYAEELEQRGSLQRFEASCSASLVRNKYRCGMGARTKEAFVTCMRLE